MIIDNAATIDDIMSTELPAIMSRLQNWWTNWDEIHESEYFLGLLVMIRVIDRNTTSRQWIPHWSFSTQQLKTHASLCEDICVLCIIGQDSKT